MCHLLCVWFYKFLAIYCIKVSALLLVLCLWTIIDYSLLQLRYHLKPCQHGTTWLGTINGGSVNMTKACQHHAEPSCAMLAQLTLVKQAGTEPVQLGTFSPASVNDIEPNPCCNRAVSILNQCVSVPKTHDSNIKTV